jgi:hypothetical protein
MLLVVVAACGGSSTPKPDAAPPPFTLYLNFEGVTLEPSTGTDDAATNMSVLVTSETTVPPYLVGVADRDTTIATIVTNTQARFAPFNVSVVTDRPAGLDYFMIVFTGAPSVIFGPGQGTGVSAVTTFPCMDTTPMAPTLDGIGFQFQNGTTSDAYGPGERGNLAIPVVALAQNINPTTANGDCLCFASADCQLNEAACTIGGAGTAVDTTNGCPGAPATEDEMSLLAGVLGTAQ